jgi:hypothetical protein
LYLRGRGHLSGTSEKVVNLPAVSWKQERQHNMITKGYLEHLDLGTDPESGKQNILVRSKEEFESLTDEEKKRAWGVISVASQIMGINYQRIYARVYAGKLPVKTLKKKVTDRIGLTLVSVHQSFEVDSSKRCDSIARVGCAIRRALNLLPWVPAGQRELITIQVKMRLRAIETEVFKGQKLEGTTEGENGQHTVG